MIRTLAVLAGGFLGFAAALMLANSTRLEPIDVADLDRTRGYTADRSSGATFETDLGKPSDIAPHEPFRDDFLEPVKIERAKAVVRAPKSGLQVPPIDRGSDLYRIQFELARLDCFAGPIDGTWSLEFHDSLGNIVLTRELDLASLNGADQLIDVLRGAEPGVCDKPDVVAHAKTESAAGRASVPDEGAVVAGSSATPVETALSRGTGEKLGSSPVVVARSMTDETPRTSAVSAPVGKNGKTSNATGGSLTTVAQRRRAAIRSYVFPSLPERHSDKIFSVDRFLAPSTAAGEQKELRMPRSVVVATPIATLSNDRVETSNLGHDTSETAATAAVSDVVVDEEGIILPTSDMASGGDGVLPAPPTEHPVRAPKPVLAETSIVSGTVALLQIEMTGDTEALTGPGTASDTANDFFSASAQSTSPLAVVSPTLTPEPALAETPKKTERVASLQIETGVRPISVRPGESMDDTDSIVMPLPVRPTEGLRDMLRKAQSERTRQRSTARKSRSEQSRRRARLTKRAASSAKVKKAKTPKKSVWKNNRKAIFADGRN